MCRVLAYLGSDSVRIDHFLFDPENSLIRQAYDAKQMQFMQNLAGFGMLAWSTESHNPQMPFFYKTKELPFFDRNLSLLAHKISAHTFLAHVRGVPYSAKEIVNQQNAHPFLYENFSIALAHNGFISQFEEIKPTLLNMMNPAVTKHIAGTTDSEWIYALFMSQFADPTADISLSEASNALLQTLQIIKDIRDQLGIASISPVNLFISNGEYLLITRFVYDYGLNIMATNEALCEYHSLWFTHGEQYGLHNGMYQMHGTQSVNSILFASEPLTTDLLNWIEIPEYSLICAEMRDGEIQVDVSNIDI